MTQPKEGLRKVALPPFAEGGVGHEMTRRGYAYLEEYVLSLDGPDHEPTEFERFMLEDFMNGLLADEAMFGPVRALLSELEAVKGENARLFEANVMIREQQKEDFTRAEAAELALSELKGEVLEKVGPALKKAAEYLDEAAEVHECEVCEESRDLTLRALSSLHEKLSSDVFPESPSGDVSTHAAGEAQQKSEGATSGGSGA